MKKEQDNKQLFLRGASVEFPGLRATPDTLENQTIEPHGWLQMNVCHVQSCLLF